VKDLFASAEAEKHASGLSGIGDVGSTLRHADTTATSELAFGRFVENSLKLS
jgi:hypothetical protein